MLECVVNVSEGRRRAILDELSEAAGGDLLDLHADPDHHRAVLTLLGEEAPRRVSEVAVARVDLGPHRGAHPRLGVVDVVPFVPLAGSSMADACRARDAYARWAGDELGVPCFLYGHERSLPDVRRGAFTTWRPDTGPPHPHPTAGASAVGCRDVLVAYNLWLAQPDLELARRLARTLRRDDVRALGLAVGAEVQVSMNLLAPSVTTPADVYDLVAAEAAIARAELVGLVPAAVLAAIDEDRWAELDLSPDRTIEARISRR